MQRTAIITDAWEPQVNGTVRTYQNLIKELEKKEETIEVLHPKSMCYNGGEPLPEWVMVKLPFYREVEFIVNPWIYKKLISSYAFLGYKIHIATEGPLGLYAKYLLDKAKHPYTTAYHTKFPEFFESYTGFSSKLLYKYFKWFHSKSKCVMVPTEYTQELLLNKGFKNVKVWSRGVNHKLFNSKYRKPWGHGYVLCVARASKEKNIDEFCQLQHPNKVFIGDGPYLEELKQKYPFVNFLGQLDGVDLARYYASADALVYPSKTDSFGLVMLESMACGTPVLAYDIDGPKEIIEENINGCIVESEYGYNLNSKIEQIVSVKRDSTEFSAKKWTWEASALDFLSNMK
tara:strand:- start:466 stop:1500 length:1035 start_codon:yes stop_codon:yes gene_type:complete